MAIFASCKSVLKYTQALASYWYRMVSHINYCEVVNFNNLKCHYFYTFHYFWCCLFLNNKALVRHNPVWDKKGWLHARIGERHALTPYKTEVILKACFSSGEFAVSRTKVDACKGGGGKWKTSVKILFPPRFSAFNTWLLRKTKSWKPTGSLNCGENFLMVYR